LVIKQKNKNNQLRCSIRNALRVTYVDNTVVVGESYLTCIYINFMTSKAVILEWSIFSGKCQCLMPVLYIWHKIIYNINVLLQL